MKDLTTTENKTELLSTAAIPTAKDRIERAKANLQAYAGPELRRAAKALKDDDVVHPDKDLLVGDRERTLAATEYISLVKLQDYIDIRKEEIRRAFFNTLDKRDRELSELDPEWWGDAPVSQIPGEVEVPENGIKFQRSGGAPKGKVIDQKALQKAHPRIYKNLIKTRVIPAVAETTIEFFDEEAFLERAKKDPQLRKFVTTKYSNPQFRVYNIFDE